MKAKIAWMLLVMRFLHQILGIVDSLLPPYQQRSASTEELYGEYKKVKEQLVKEGGK